MEPSSSTATLTLQASIMATLPSGLRVLVWSMASVKHNISCLVSCSVPSSHDQGILVAIKPAAAGG